MLKNRKLIDIEELDDTINNAVKLKHLQPALTTTGKMYHQQGHKGTAHGMKFDSQWEFAFFFVYDRERRKDC